jgi:hypothetical protein
VNDDDRRDFVFDFGEGEEGIPSALSLLHLHPFEVAWSTFRGEPSPNLAPGHQQPRGGRRC